VLTLLAVVLMESIHHQLALSRGLLSRIAVAFTTMGAAILVVDYASQLTFLQPALLLGETEGLSPWSQYNPHGIFIALENVGYVLLSFAFLFVGAAMVGTPWKPGAQPVGSRLRWRADVGAAGGLLRRLSGAFGPVRGRRHRPYVAGVDRRACAVDHRLHTDSTARRRPRRPP
jgi:hypothetical protein